MKKTNEKRRIILAVTERSPLRALWRAAKEHLADPHDEIITFVVHDDRWRRAASLPFTREVSRASGRHQDFTQWRAAQIDDETAARLARQLKRIAKHAKRQIAFEILPEANVGDVLEQLTITADVLIVSSELKRRPVYAKLVELRCKLLFVGPEE
ncbi:MAG: hypothetical protein OER91_00560 [Gammaproteobacteria bacterium]|nr:hypothetical protein [Gammaproteobacteria bacterium]